MSYRSPVRASPPAVGAQARPESSWLEPLRTFLRILAAGVLLLYALFRLFLLDQLFPTAIPVPIAVSVLAAPLVSTLLALLASLCSFFLWRRKRRRRKQSKPVKKDSLKDRLADLFGAAQTFLERLSHLGQLLLSLLPTIVLLGALAVSVVTEGPRFPLQHFAYQLLQACNNPLTKSDLDVQSAEAAAGGYSSADPLFIQDMAGRAATLQDDANQARQAEADLASVIAPANYQSLLDGCRQAVHATAQCFAPDANLAAELPLPCYPPGADPYYLAHGMVDYLNHAGMFLPSQVVATLDTAQTQFKNSALYNELTSDENRLSQDLLALR